MSRKRKDPCCKPQNPEGCPARVAQLTEAAQGYHDNHHWVPLRLDGKAPYDAGWTKHTLKDAIPKFKDTDNIGILLGKPSGDLIRLDPDFETIPDVTSILFPEPTLMFGRATSTQAGRLIICDIKSKDFTLPNSTADHHRLPQSKGLKVYQILSTGKQTMAPPSIHPDTKELLTWRSKAQPAFVDAPELLRRVGIEAFLMAVRQFWPARGTRNEAAMALARVLLEALATHHPDDAERCAIVDELVLAVAMAGGDGEASRSGKERATATLEKMNAGTDTTGLPRLIELFELPADVAKTFRKWLGLGPGARVSVEGLICLDDFVSYLPEHNYIYLRTVAHWPAASVNARLPRVKIGVKEDGTPITISPSEWLDRYRRVEVQTWMPGHPTLIKGHEFTEDDGLKPHADSATFNLYHPPTIKLGDPSGAGRWLDLIKELYPDDFGHIVACFAHARQRPHVKINHVLFLGGDQGIGKDTIFAGLERAVGVSNYRTITPSQIIESQFNGEFKTVVLYISEVHDLGIRDRIKFYNVMKDKLAVPPTNIRINEKYRQPYYIPNLLFAVMTSNFQTGGIYLPPNDRRHYVAWSPVKKGNHPEEWWRDYYRWFDGGGDECIAGYLQVFDLSDFNPKAEPVKTEAWHAMVNASRSSEEMELADVLERFNNGAATLVMIRNGAIELKFFELARWLGEARNHKAISERLEAAGYTVIRNPDETTRGRWRVLQMDGSSTIPRAIYGPATLGSMSGCALRAP
jgi:hypothetical protein